MTLIVNLFGPPCSGKSTVAAAVYADLKRAGAEVELAAEFAKDLAWEQSSAIGCQPLITGTQIWRIERLVAAGVDVVVTDSPPLLGLLYGAREWHMADTLGAFQRKHPSLNYLLLRNHPYNASGRYQTEAEADDLAGRLEAILDWEYVPHTRLTASQYGIIFHDVINHVRQGI